MLSSIQKRAIADLDALELSVYPNHSKYKAVIHNAVLRTHKGVSHDAIEMGVKSLRYKRLAKKGGARAIIAKGSHAVEAGKYVAKHLGKGAVKAITKHIRHISTSPFAPAIAVVAAATALHLAGFTKNHK